MSSEGKTEDEVTTAFESAIWAAMTRVMLADGSVGEEELSTIASFYEGLTGTRPAEDLIAAWAVVVELEGPDLLTSLAELSPHLTDAAKETVVKAALLVTFADGEVAEGEMHLVKEISSAIDLSEARLRDTVDRFTRPVSGSDTTER